MSNVTTSCQALSLSFLSILFTGGSFITPLPTPKPFQNKLNPMGSGSKKGIDTRIGKEINIGKGIAIETAISKGISKNIGIGKRVGIHKRVGIGKRVGVHKAVGIGIGISSPTLQSPPWVRPDNVTLIPQFALTRGNFVLPLSSTSVAKLIAAPAHQQANKVFNNSKANSKVNCT
jgi:hypothetical protein